MRARTIMLGAVLAGCSGGGDDGGAAARFEPIEGPADTVHYAAAGDALVALVATAGFKAETIGDVAAYVNSEATTPTAPGEFASLYYETGGLRAAVEGAQERRPDRTRNDQAGSRIAAQIATALTQGAVSATADGQRSSPRWYASFAARRLDQFMLLEVWDGLTERSAAGFDRALGYLIDGDGGRHGLGRIIDQGDQACGTAYFSALSGALADARPAFVAALEAKGELDPLDRLRIQEGDSPEYDAALILADKALVAGLGTAFLALMQAEPFDATAQAAAQGAFEALVADLQIAETPDCGGEGSVVDQIGRTLDAATPGEVDRARVQCLVAGALEINPCGG